MPQGTLRVTHEFGAKLALIFLSRKNELRRWSKYQQEGIQPGEADHFDRPVIDCDDVLQDAMLKALLTAPPDSSDDGQLAAWLFRVISSVRCDGVKKLHRVRLLGKVGLLADDEPPAEHEQDLFADLHHRQHLELRIAAGLRALSGPHREILRLRYWLGLTNKEAGLHLGITETAARALTARARRSLRAELDEEICSC